MCVCNINGSYLCVNKCCFTQNRNTEVFVPIAVEGCECEKHAPEIHSKGTVFGPEIHSKGTVFGTMAMISRISLAIKRPKGLPSTGSTLFHRVLPHDRYRRSVVVLRTSVRRLDELWYLKIRLLWHDFSYLTSRIHHLTHRAHTQSRLFFTTMFSNNISDGMSPSVSECTCPG